MNEQREVVARAVAKCTLGPADVFIEKTAAGRKYWVMYHRADLSEDDVEEAASLGMSSTKNCVSVFSDLMHDIFWVRLILPSIRSTEVN